MKALISGRAGAYAIKVPQGWDISRRGRLGSIRGGPTDVARVLGTTPDLIEVEVKAVREADLRLETEWAKDRALLLTIALLDPEEPEPGLDQLARLLEGLIGRDHVLSYLEDQFCQKELPETSLPERAERLCADLPLTSNFFRQIIVRQPIIKQLRESFDALAEDLFGGLSEKTEFRERAISEGAFRILVAACDVDGLPDTAIFELHEKLRRLPNARQVVVSWTSAFRKMSTSPPPLRHDLTEDFQREAAEFGGGPAGHGLLRNALEQQDAILDRVASGDYENARRFARDLERHQLASSGPSYLAMSLTRLSQHARQMEAYELELEWASRAVDIQPHDARTRTQFADALLHADRIDEALEEYKQAGELGERAYALGGCARAMRLLGRHEDELAYFGEACRAAENTDEEIHPLVGLATALVDLNRIEEATAHLTAAESKFPYEPLPRLALAGLLMRQNLFEEAWRKFEQAEELSSADGKIAAWTGFAYICRRTGLLTEARRRYSDLAERFPRTVDVHVGLIDTLRNLGEREKAAMYARVIAERFPGSPRAAAKHAETTSEAGRHSQARQLFTAAIERFPRDIRIVIAQVRAIRREGRYNKALQVIDTAVNRFPYSRQIKRARADMLRRLGKINEARVAYSDLIKTDPLDIHARNGLASAEIFNGTEGDIVATIANDDPKTPQQWRSFLLVACALDRNGQESLAYDRLAWGYRQCPFAAERRMFASVISNVAVRTGQARKAPKIEVIPERDVGNLIDFQVAAATKNARARSAYGALSRNLPPRFSELRDEIARNYGILNDRPSRSKSWITRQLNDELVLAVAA